MSCVGREIVHLPYIKRFMVNIAGERSGGIRPVAFIPDEQMVKLRRMLDDSEEPVIIDPVRCLLERGYALTAVSCMV